MTPSACLLLHRKSCNRDDVVEAVRAVGRTGAEFRVRIPWDLNDMDRFVEEALNEGIGRIVAGGGDGTLNLVANMLMKPGRAGRASLGVLPLGTANDFARGAGLPRDDLSAALDRAISGEATLIDLGVVNGQFFINVASGGFGAEVTAATPKDLKAALGGSAYSLMGLVKLMNLKPYSGRLILPDGSTEDVSALFVAIGNNRFAGGGFDVAPKADMTDGLLDLAAVSSAGLGDLAKLASEIADPFNPNNSVLRYRQLTAFQLEADQTLHLNLDGDPIEERNFDVSVRPRALRVVLGEQH